MEINIKFILKIVLMVWVVLSGLLMIATGIVHFIKNDFFAYKSPTKVCHGHNLCSQGSFAVSTQAIILILVGIVFAILPFFSILGKIKFIVTFKIAYNLVTLTVFYLISGFLIFPISGLMGLILACFFWLTFIILLIVTILSFFVFQFKISSLRDEDE